MLHDEKEKPMCEMLPWFAPDVLTFRVIDSVGKFGSRITISVTLGESSFVETTYKPGAEFFSKQSKTNKWKK